MTYLFSFQNYTLKHSQLFTNLSWICQIQAKWK